MAAQGIIAPRTVSSIRWETPRASSRATAYNVVQCRSTSGWGSGMIEYYLTTDGVTSQVKELEPGTWVKLVNPTLDEVNEISTTLGIDRDDLMAASDPEEKTRVEFDGENLMVLVDTPSAKHMYGERARNTVPLGIFLLHDYVVTVCSEDPQFLSAFHEGRVRGFSTWSRSRFVVTILLRNALLIQRVLADIDRRRIEFETGIDDVRSEADLVALHGLETSLVYLSTSLRGNGNVLARLQRSTRLRRHEGMDELLEDAYVENQQAIEMAQIYRDVIDGTRDLLSSVMDLRLNDVMQRLTWVTIIMTIPTIVSGFYGMNVNGDFMPLANTAHGFGIICILTILFCGILMLWLRKRRRL